MVLRWINIKKVRIRHIIFSVRPKRKLCLPLPLDPVKTGIMRNKMALIKLDCSNLSSASTEFLSRRPTSYNTN